MKKNKVLPTVIKNGCVIFTFITVITYIAGSLIGGENKEFIPTLKWILLFLAFSLVLAAANLLLKNNKLSLGIRLALHFFATALLYFVTVILCGGFIASGAQTLIAFAVFLVLYIIFAIVYAIVAGTTGKKKNKKEKYESMFS